MTYFKDSGLKEFRLLKNDFYQLNGVLGYILSEKAMNICGFEAFVRKISTDVTNKNRYIFSGEKDVKKFIKTIKKELKDPEFIRTFTFLVISKIKDPILRSIYSIKINDFFSQDFEFDFSVAKEGSVCKPLIPVFQYKGPIFIGQLIESQILNMINGKTGFSTFMQDSEDYETINRIDFLLNNEFEYFKLLTERAKDYRNSFDGILLEAGLRRAPNQKIANMATLAALTNGWNATSNVDAFFTLGVPLEFIGGSMMHSFVMSFRKEIQAYKKWISFFPDNKVLLTCTNNPTEAAKMLVENNLKPTIARIDSEPIFELIQESRDIFNANNWNDIELYSSGDMTPELLSGFKDKGIKLERAMVGTKFVNLDVLANINCGFVYKLVQIDIDVEEFDDEIEEWHNGNSEVELIDYLKLNKEQYNQLLFKEFVTIFPTKKDKNKINYSGLKRLKKLSTNRFIIEYNLNEDFKLDLSQLNKMNENTEITFLNNEGSLYE